MRVTTSWRLVLVLDLNLIFLWAWLDPFCGGGVLAALLLAAAALTSVAVLRPPGWLRSLDAAFRGSERAQRMALLVSSLVIFGGGLEYAARGLTGLGVVESYSAMRTMLPGGIEDWRLAHLTADRHREPDPELLWRPVDRAPYNRQRFKGPELPAAKPPGAVRIFCYGDSNTDGPESGGWPERLAAELAARPGGGRFEVVNAGVAGYSSHQGLLRFRRDAPRFRPDLVLVSFGWNDLAPALGAPDRAFRPPAAPLLAAQRLLLHYRFFLVARRYWPRRPAPAAAVGPRVPLADYRANLEGMLDTADRHGARAVLLTRPHREPVAVLEGLAGNWRRRVPAYNRAVRRLAADRGAPLIDVQQVFAGARRAFVDECHFTPHGHARMARLVAAQLARQGLLRQDPVAVRRRNSAAARAYR